MTHYQKLATMMFRIIGTIILIISSLLLITAFMLMMPAMNPVMILIAFLPYLIAGIVSIALSRLLAKLVCLGLEKSDEQ